MEKFENRLCPVCSKIYTHKHVDKITLGHVAVGMKCEAGHEWVEHYAMTYVGYDHADTKYDRFGQKICEPVTSSNQDTV